jgi:hypothetical protein
VVTGPPAPFSLAVTEFQRDKMDFAFQRQGALIATLAVDSSLSCFSTWCSEERFAANLACFSRDLVRQLLTEPTTSAALRNTSRPETPAAVTPRPAPEERKPLAGKLAVLELRNFAKDLTHENAQYFTDVIRQNALRLQAQLEVMTRENLVVLLQATGRKLEECEGECEVDTGRRIGADLIISGEIQKLGTLYKISLRLHDTHDGRLLSSSIASGRSIEELDQSAQKAGGELLGGL